MLHILARLVKDGTTHVSQEEMVSDVSLSQRQLCQVHTALIRSFYDFICSAF